MSVFSFGDITQGLYPLLENQHIRVLLYLSLIEIKEKRKERVNAKRLGKPVGFEAEIIRCVLRPSRPTRRAVPESPVRIWCRSAIPPIVAVRARPTRRHLHHDVIRRTRRHLNIREIEVYPATRDRDLTCGF